MSTLAYRPEIDGLRAVAVIPVVLFHLKVPGLPGGFIGVDVFFVISGYLITSIIVDEHRRGSFRFSQFWLRRVRRILPALVAMVAATLAAAALVMYGPDLHEAGQQATAALLSAANISHWLLAGDYWGASAESSPFLHTWSLSVEEQFYLLFPLLLVLALGRMPRAALLLLAGLTATSFALFLYGTQKSPFATFYLLPTRAWELGIGACAAIGLRSARVTDPAGTDAQPPSGRDLLAIAGLAAVLLSYAFVGGQGGITPLLAIPVLGTIAVIACAHGPRSPVRRLLATAPLVWVGRISYSLYLWHWPILVLAAQWAEAHRRALGVVPLLAGIVAVSALSYRYVEVPTRRNRRAVPWIVVALLVTLVASIAMTRARIDEDISAFSATHWDGNAYSVVPDPPWRHAPSRRMDGLVLASDDVAAGAYANGGIVKPHGGPVPQIVVIGDSHALMWARVLDDVAREQHRTIAFQSADGTPAFFAIPPRRDARSTRYFSADQKLAFDRARLDALERWRPAVVVVAARWSAIDRPGEARSLLERIGQVGARAVLVEQPPELFFGDRNAPQYLAYLRLQPADGVRQSVRTAAGDYERGRALVRELAAACAHCTLVETADVLRRDGRAWVLDGRDVLYIDDDHLSRAGAALFHDRLAAALATR